MDTEQKTILEEQEQQNTMNVDDPSASDTITGTPSDSSPDDSDDFNLCNEYHNSPLLEVGTQALNAAHSIVNACLSQLCK